jgi:protein tyrosine/serine phosphatase
MTARPDSIVGSIRAIATARGAVLAHCAAGKDRTGTVVALALDAARIDRGLIVADYLATAQRIDAIMTRLVSSETYRPGLEGHDPQAHAPLPGTMERVLELIDEDFGGSVSWLTEHGLTAAELEQLRGRLAPVSGG